MTRSQIGQTIVRRPVIAAMIGIVVLAPALIWGAHHDHRGSHSTPDSPAVTHDSKYATGFDAPATDIYGRRVDIPKNPAGQPLVQTAQRITPNASNWLTAAPTGTTSDGGWQRVHGVSVPFSASDGPASVRDGMAAGYAHTPRGAALAAVYISRQLAARPGDPAVYNMTVLDPIDQDKRDRGIASGKLPQQQPETVTRWLPAPDAFEIESYSDGLCVLRTATRANPGGTGQSPSWTASRLVVTWVDGDWKLRSDNGVHQSEQVPSLAGWTPW